MEPPFLFAPSAAARVPVRVDGGGVSDLLGPAG